MMAEECSMNSRPMRAKALINATGSDSARAFWISGRSPKAMGSSSPPKETSRTSLSGAGLEENRPYRVGSEVSAAPAIASRVVAG
jgi:hypothetical protein